MVYDRYIELFFWWFINQRSHHLGGAPPCIVVAQRVLNGLNNSCNYGFIYHDRLFRTDKGF